mmetsp:Transcript_4502/g.10427  ORF Transcript_4502/g.10427 Transcript_4502/m.10427 type:complete len:297 (+) Transcript_4502:1019-1909(+)
MMGPFGSPLSFSPIAFHCTRHAPAVTFVTVMPSGGGGGSCTIVREASSMDFLAEADSLLSLLILLPLLPLDVPEDSEAPDLADKADLAEARDSSDAPRCSFLRPEDAGDASLPWPEADDWAMRGEMGSARSVRAAAEISSLSRGLALNFPCPSCSVSFFAPSSRSPGATTYSYGLSLKSYGAFIDHSALKKYMTQNTNSATQKTPSAGYKSRLSFAVSDMPIARQMIAHTPMAMPLRKRFHLSSVISRRRHALRTTYVGINCPVTIKINVNTNDAPKAIFHSSVCGPWPLVPVLHC